jgi:hypothetical protein
MCNDEIPMHSKHCDKCVSEQIHIMGVQWTTLYLCCLYNFEQSMKFSCGILKSHEILQVGLIQRNGIVTLGRVI